MEKKIYLVVKSTMQYDGNKVLRSEVWNFEDWKQARVFLQKNFIEIQNDMFKKGTLSEASLEYEEGGTRAIIYDDDSCQIRLDIIETTIPL
jgi:hypothetical protein